MLTAGSAHCYPNRSTAAVLLAILSLVNYWVTPATYVVLALLESSFVSFVQRPFTRKIVGHKFVSDLCLSEMSKSKLSMV